APPDVPVVPTVVPGAPPAPVAVVPVAVVPDVVVPLVVPAPVPVEVVAPDPLVVPPSASLTHRIDRHESPGSHVPPIVHAHDSLPMAHELLFDEEHAVIHAKAADSATKLAPTMCILFIATPVSR